MRFTKKSSATPEQVSEQVAHKEDADGWGIEKDNAAIDTEISGEYAKDFSKFTAYHDDSDFAPPPPPEEEKQDHDE